jgi:hypothetical protein
MEKTVRRSRETEVMSTLERIVASVARAQSLVQDDSKVNGVDVMGIVDCMLHVRALTLEVEESLLGKDGGG